MAIREIALLTPTDQVEVRPRTLGEICDDAWRLSLTNLPLFLLLTGFFLIPNTVLLLILLTQSWPTNHWLSWVLSIGLALLLPCVGLGSAACQEIFHCWGEKQPVTVAKALRMACRRGLNHVT